MALTFQCQTHCEPQQAGILKSRAKKKRWSGDAAESVISHPITPSVPSEEEKSGRSAFMYISGSGTFREKGIEKGREASVCGCTLSMHVSVFMCVFKCVCGRL